MKIFVRVWLAMFLIVSLCLPMTRPTYLSCTLTVRSGTPNGLASPMKMHISDWRGCSLMTASMASLAKIYFSWSASIKTFRIFVFLISLLAT